MVLTEPIIQRVGSYGTLGASVERYRPTHLREEESWLAMKISRE